MLLGYCVLLLIILFGTALIIVVVGVIVIDYIIIIILMVKFGLANHRIEKKIPCNKNTMHFHKLQLSKLVGSNKNIHTTNHDCL